MATNYIRSGANSQYAPLDQWVQIVTDSSQNGQKVIQKFEDCSGQNADLLHNAVALIVVQLKTMNQDGKRKYREIVVKNCPQLLSNFDYHFKSFFSST